MARGKETRAKYHNPRQGYTFTFEQRQQALENNHYQCEYTGKLARLEAHHIIAIWFAREVGIPPEVITSTMNLAFVEHETHVYLHQQESRYQYAYLAWFLFGIDVEYDEHKDDWRKDPNHPINNKK